MELKKKDYLIIFLILFIITLVYASFVSGNFNNITGFVVKDTSSDKEEIEIEEELKKEEEVPVIIELNEENELSLITKLVVEEVTPDSLPNEEFEGKHEFETFNGFSGKITKEGFEKLKNNPRVKGIYLDREFQISLSDSVPLINADSTWNIKLNDINITGDSTVCVLDTGIDYIHPDLGGCLGSGCKVIDGHDFVTPDNDPIDDNGHGTHVAGIIAANGDLRGVAPDAKLIALKVCDSSGTTCFVSDVTKAIEWCIFNQTKYDINTITMSFGGGAFSDICDAESGFESLVSAINSAVSSGISLFASSGNSGSTTSIVAPACISNVISVSATDKNDNIASFSDRNNLLDLMAPGSNIVSTNLGGGSASKSGTSMATPHATASAVLLHQYIRELNGTILNQDGIKYALKNGKDIYDSGSDLTFPRIDISNAILSFDTIKPSIYFVDPTPSNSSFVEDPIYVNVTSNENLDFAILEFDNINKTMNGTSQNFYFNQTNLNHIHYFKVYGNDTAGNWNFTELKEVYIENNAPVIYLKNSLNGSLLENKEVIFTFNVTDDLSNITNCNLGLNNTNTFMDAENNTEVNYITNLLDEFYFLNLTCIDITKKYSNVTSLFNVDGAPTIFSGTPNGTIGDTNIILSVETDENAICSGKINELLNFTFEGKNLIHNFTIELNYSDYNVYTTCNDTSGKTSEYNWSFTSEETPTTTTSTTTTTEPPAPSPGGGSSGGSRRIYPTTQTPPLVPIIPPPAPPTTTTIKQEKIESFKILEVEEPTAGLANIVGKTVSDLSKKPALPISVSAILIISLIFIVYKKFRKYY